MNTKNENKLAALINAACTGRGVHEVTLEKVALDALEMVGDELNVISFAMNADAQSVCYIDHDELVIDVHHVMWRAQGIVQLLRLVKMGKLVLVDDDADETTCIPVPS